MSRIENDLPNSDNSTISQSVIIQNINDIRSTKSDLEEDRGREGQDVDKSKDDDGRCKKHKTTTQIWNRLFGKKKKATKNSKSNDNAERLAETHHLKNKEFAVRSNVVETGCFLSEIRPLNIIDERETFPANNDDYNTSKLLNLTLGNEVKREDRLIEDTNGFQDDTMQNGKNLNNSSQYSMMGFKADQEVDIQESLIFQHHPATVNKSSIAVLENDSTLLPELRDQQISSENLKCMYETCTETDKKDFMNSLSTATFIVSAIDGCNPDETTNLLNGVRNRLITMDYNVLTINDYVKEECVRRLSPSPMGNDTEDEDDKEMQELKESMTDVNISGFLLMEDPKQTYTEVEKDIKSIIKDLLLESREIKTAVLKTGIPEEEAPALIFEYIKEPSRKSRDVVRYVMEVLMERTDEAIKLKKYKGIPTIVNMCEILADGGMNASSGDDIPRHAREKDLLYFGVDELGAKFELAKEVFGWESKISPLPKISVKSSFNFGRAESPKENLDKCSKLFEQLFNELCEYDASNMQTMPNIQVDGLLENPLAITENVEENAESVEETFNHLVDDDDGKKKGTCRCCEKNSKSNCIEQVEAVVVVSPAEEEKQDADDVEEMEDTVDDDISSKRGSTSEASDAPNTKRKQFSKQELNTLEEITKIEENVALNERLQSIDRHDCD